ncbi:MAG: penicillin-binding protein [Bacilli bacterium]|nr:penicillin-binding protein [Bacilli bacterium]
MKQEKNTVLSKKWKFPRIVLLLFLVLFLVLIGQYGYLSLSSKVYGRNLRGYADDRMTVEKILYAKRGTIYDSNNLVLAQNVTSYKLIAYLNPNRTTDPDNPQHVVDPHKTAAALAPVLDAPEEYLLERLLKYDTDGAYQVYFGNYGSKLTELKKQEIEALDLPGLDFEESTKRYYPNGTFASYIVGYARKGENDVINGELGVEAEYDELLSGKDGYLMYQKDPSNFKIPDTMERRVDAVNGYDIYLTIDSSIQRFAEDVVANITETYGPEWMLITIMDAKTGAILASATSPTFDPNSLPEDMTYQNPIISYEYEPGSTMKIYTYMCAIDKGTYRGDEGFLSGSYTTGPNTIHDWNDVGWGTISYDVGFEYSSNIGALNVVRNFLNKGDLKACLKKYGFGAKTGVELSGETKGNIDYNEDVEIDALTTSFGQGISTTAVQHLQAMSMIANNGYMVKPHIISKMVDSKGNEIITDTKSNAKQVIAPATAAKVRELMYNTVTDEWATGHPYYLEGYDIIGKTGTAQIYENGRYLEGEGNYLTSFAGMWPYNDPEIIIYAAIKKPYSRSSRVLSEGVKELVKNISKYRNMYAERPIESDINIIELEDYKNTNISITKSALEDQGISVYVIGDGSTIINQYPKKGTKIATNDKTFLLTDSSNFIIPNMFGWSRNEVIAYAKLTGMKYHFNGFGYVVRQSVIENSPIDPKNEISFDLVERIDLNNVNKEEKEEENE